MTFDAWWSDCITADSAVVLVAKRDKTTMLPFDMGNAADARIARSELMSARRMGLPHHTISKAS